MYRYKNVNPSMRNTVGTVVEMVTAMVVTMKGIMATAMEIVIMGTVTTVIVITDVCMGRMRIW